MTGQAAGSRDDQPMPIYALPSFARHLEERGVDWRWHSLGPATLRMAGLEHRLDNYHPFTGEYLVDDAHTTTIEGFFGHLVLSK